ncbi:MAG: glycoside hydrolase family 38 N-terminal domain-containing protein [Planctomycetota bacterium]
MNVKSLRIGGVFESYVWGIGLFPVVFWVFILGGTVEGVEGSESVGGGAFRLISIKPTVLLVREQGTLLQAADIEVASESEMRDVAVDVKFGSRQRSTGAGKVAEGKSVLRVYVPEAITPREVEFVVRSGRTVVGRRKMTWQPQRHWSVYVIPITHHDLGYTDTIENVMNLYDTFYDDVIRFCEETADRPFESRYRYSVEGTWSLKHYVENRSDEVLVKFSKYVKEGRIEIGALFGNEISGMCGHEELIRLLYPSFRYQRLLGGSIRTGSITDVPGLSWGLPTVMAGAGVKYFFAGLPTYFEWGRNDIHTFWDESAVLRKGRPDAFWWEGPDGEKVLVYYQGSYGFFNAVTGPHSYDYVLKNLPGMLMKMQDEDTPFSVMRYIHNGVDNHPPSVEISRIVKEWNEKWAYPKLIVSTNTMFFEALEKQCNGIRTFRGELPHTDYVVGAISTAKETAINRVSHERLQSAEKFATIADLAVDYPYPAEKLREAYDSMLLYDEHTWGKDYPAGPEQDWGWNEKSQYSYKAAGLTNWILRKSLENIAWRISLDKEGRHIVVFNPLAFERTDVVRVTKHLEKGEFELIDEDTGEKVAWQLARLPSAQAAWPYSAQRYSRGQWQEHELYDLVFVAENVPSMGYKTYRIAGGKKASSPASEVKVGEGEIENRFYKVVLDSKSGALKSIYDNELDREMVDADADAGVNQFVAKWVQTGKVEGPRDVAIRKGQSGGVYGSIVATSVGAGCPQITQEIILYDKIKRIDFANRVLKDSTPLQEIYFAFPFKIDNPQIRFEGSNSVIEPIKDQFPGSNSNYYSVQHWANVSGAGAGVTLSAVDSHLLEFGGLWPCYVSQAHHGFTPPGFGADFVGPEDMANGRIYSFIIDGNFRTNFQPVQQSDMLFRYSVTTHKGDWRNGRRNFGWEAQNPLIPVVVDGKKEGILSKKASFCSVDKANVLLTTLKRSEVGEALILRLIETEGRSVSAKVTLPSVSIVRAHETNLIEEPEKAMYSSEHSVSVPVKSYGISTIRLEVQ